MKRIIYIYTLSDPISYETRYVGKTLNIKKRYSEHINESKTNNTRKSNWIRKLSKEEKLPIIDVIDICDECSFSFWEMHYISLYKSWGFRLLNHTDGGEGASGYKYSDDMRLKKSESMKGPKNHFYGKNHTKETKKILSEVDKKGEKNPMWNKNHKISSKNIMSSKKSGLYDGVKNPRARKLYQYTINNELVKIWDYAKECADFYNISRGNISTFAKNNSKVDDKHGKYRILNGFIFKFH